MISPGKEYQGYYFREIGKGVKTIRFRLLSPSGTVTSLFCADEVEIKAVIDCLIQQSKGVQNNDDGSLKDKELDP